MIFRKSLFCSWAVFGTLLGPILGWFWHPKSRFWVVLGRSGEVLGWVGWCVVVCCVVLCGLRRSWVRSWVGFGGRTVLALHDRGSPRAAQRSKGSLGWMAPPRPEAVVWVGLRCFVCCAVCCCWCCGVFCGVLLCLVVLFCLVFLCCVGWSGAPKDEEKARENEF